MDKIIEYLPFIIPVVIIQFILLACTIHHILTHENYKRGNRKIWLAVSIIGMNYVGPIAYILLGKEEE